MALSSATFGDPDDNSWLFHSMRTHESVKDLARALCRAAVAQGQDERQIGQAGKNWPEPVCLVYDEGAKRPGFANISSPTDSWEESNHAF